MKNNKNIAMSVLAVCFLSLVVGIINNSKPAKTMMETSTEVSTRSGMSSLFSSPNDKIALIKLNGPITSEESGGLFSNFYTGESVKKALNRAIDDDTVKGVIIRTNTPGGTVALSQEIYQTIIELRKSKPVIVSMQDVTASGGYYIAAAADRIFAEPGTLTGSIGVIFNSMDAHQLFGQKLGITNNTIKSGKFKDIGSPYRAMADSEKYLLQDIIDTTYNQFINDIKKGRIDKEDPYSAEKSLLTVEDLKQYADGRIFTGEQAQKLGFVDSLGGLKQAVDAMNTTMIKDKLKIDKQLPLVPYNSPTNLDNLFLETSTLFGGKTNASNDILKSLLPLSSQYAHQTLFLWE